MELLVLPYDSAHGDSLLARLITELTEGGWSRFRAAVAFARLSGNALELVEALKQFLQSGGKVSLTFGANTFGPDEAGSDLEAIKQLVDAVGSSPDAQFFLYHEAGRTFHPKVYLFDRASENSALLIVGSSNWTRGGHFENVEVCALLDLDLKREDHSQIYQKISHHFENHWREL